MGAERFLVTGAAGCIGAWVVKTLVDEGADVVGLDLDTEPRRLREIMGGEISGATMVAGDVTSKESVGAALDAHGITHVIHLAGLQIPFCRADPIRGAMVNVVGTVTMLECMRERLDRIQAPLVFASSAAIWALADAAAVAVDENALSRPPSHYGVYKQANEGNARIYWEEGSVPSIGVRPYTVYGPARDQGVTAAPTHAMRAAALGEEYRIPYGGRTFFNYTRDLAETLIQASRAAFRGAGVFNVPGVAADIAEIVAEIVAVEPSAAGRITFDPQPLALPEALAVGGLEAAIGPVPVRPLADGVRATVEHYRSLA
jgi:UDP-glucuronate 4-epimerase